MSFGTPTRALTTLLAVAGLLAGCASPRYQIVTRYDGPADAAGRTCVAGCERSLTDCQGRCRSDYQACLKAVEPDAQARYAQLLERYQEELSRYRDALERYRLELWVGYYHDPWWWGAPMYAPWHWPTYYPAPPPSLPGRTAVLDEYRRQVCRKECGCQPLYDACFVACGGRKTTEERCLSHCPEVVKP
jgi:hypothetical protein